MTLVHRVTALEPAGGPFGLGLIRAEADIHPGDWFMVCHFVDDRVMPGTLMYECCLHTLRIFMMRMGWIGSRGQVAFEPVPGIANRLKCRGQIIESSRVVTYEITIKERGYRPEPYAIADALIYADGKPIVEVTDMALQLVGNQPARTRAALGWCRSTILSPTGRSAAPAYRRASRSSTTTGFSHSRIGKPSDAFGERLPGFRRGALHCPAPRPALPVPRSDHAHRRGTLGDGCRAARPRPSTTSLPTPGISRPIARIACRLPSCSRSPCRRAAGWPRTWDRP